MINYAAVIGFYCSSSTSIFYRVKFVNSWISYLKHKQSNHIVLLLYYISWLNLGSYAHSVNVYGSQLYYSVLKVYTDYKNIRIMDMDVKSLFIFIKYIIIRLDNSNCSSF